MDITSLPLRVAAGALGVSAVIWLIRRGTPADARTVAFGRYMMVFLLLFGLGATALGVSMILGVLPGRGTENWLTRATFLGFGVLGLGTFADGLTRRLEWDEAGLVTRKYLGRAKRHAWGQVREISYVTLGAYWCIRFSDGSAFAFAETMQGANAFLAAAARRKLVPDDHHMDIDDACDRRYH